MDRVWRRHHSFVAGLGASVALCAAATAEAQVSIGINLAPIDYFTREVAFTDVFKQSKPFDLLQNGVDPGLVDPSLTTFDANGYPTSLGLDQYVRTTWDKPKGYDEGRHVLLYDGTGTLQLQLNATNIVQTPGRIEFDFTTGFDRTRIQMRINATDPLDPVRNIRIVPLYAESAYAAGAPANPFRPSFLNTWSSASTLRFMDWTKVNGSSVVHWSERQTHTDQTQADDGVALLYQIKLANIQNANPWFTIPHLANDHYIRQAATQIRNGLKSGLQARIEFSNEVWNNTFGQAQYAQEQGLAEGLDANPGRAKLYWYSKRSVEMFRIFEDVFTFGGTDPTGMDRLLRVVSAQSSNDWTSQQVLGFNYDFDGDGTVDSAADYIDALAIAPYFGEVVRTAARAEEYLAMTPGQIADIARADLLLVARDIAKQREVADDFGVRLFAYEGGQDFRGANGQENNQALTDALTAFNAHPLMRELYLEYLAAWEDAGGEEMVLYNSLGEPNKWGSWGQIEYEGQPLAESPKYLAMLQYLGLEEPWLTGDYDLDGLVGQGDLALVLEYWGQAVADGQSPAQAWTNTTHITAPLIGQDEIALVLQNWGNSLAPPSLEGATVPEPATIGLLLAPLLALRRSRLDQ